MAEQEKFRVVPAAPGWRIVYRMDTGANHWQPLEAGEPVLAWLVEVTSIPDRSLLARTTNVVVRAVLPTGQASDNAWGFLAPDGQAYEAGGDAYASLEAADQAAFDSQQGGRGKKKRRK